MKKLKLMFIKEGANERFTLLRNKDKAVNLSEGEKTAIAFSFFLTKLLEIEDLKTVIVYIDDPISSFDNNHIFQVNALIKEFFFYKPTADDSTHLRSEQLFISTHSHEFFSLLRELPSKIHYINELGKTTTYFFIKRL